MSLVWHDGNLLVSDQGVIQAAYRIRPESYPHLSAGQKDVVAGGWAALANVAHGDIHVLRLHAPADPARYLADRRREARAAGLRAAWGRHLETHLPAIERTVEVECYLLVTVNGAAESGAAIAALGRGGRRLFERVARLAGLGGEGAPVGAAELAAADEQERSLFARLSTVIGEGAVARCDNVDVQRMLLRPLARAWRRDVVVDDHWDAGAAVLDPDLRLVPCDGTYYHYAPLDLEENGRVLTVVSPEEGVSYQSAVVVTQLPDQLAFPGAAEYAFMPFRQLGFPVDLSLRARWISPERALRTVRRRGLEATHALRDAATTDSGASWQSHLLPDDAKALEDSLSRSPTAMLQLGLTMWVAAPDPATLEQRVDQVRSRLDGNRVQTAVPRWRQGELWLDARPGASGRASAPWQHWSTVEQFGTMGVFAADRVGSRGGPYLGHTLADPSSAVHFAVGEAARLNRSPAILMWGGLGSGKTTAAQLVAVQTALAGGRVVTIDPKPDHRLDDVPELDGMVDVLTLSDDPRMAGVLDPLAVAMPDQRVDDVASFLAELLPERDAREHESAIRAAVQSAVADGIERSADLGPYLEAESVELARLVETWGSSGLGRLALGRPDADGDLPLLRRPVRTLRCGGLDLPAPGTPRSEWRPKERLSAAIVGLLAGYAMKLVSEDRSRVNLLVIDEAWFLLESASGQALIERLVRTGRSMNAAVLLATQQLGEVTQSLQDLIDTRFVFGQRTAAAAADALRLLGLDVDDPEAIAELTSFRSGRCLMRDLHGRVGAVQVDLSGNPALARALSTTPSGDRGTPSSDIVEAA